MATISAGGTHTVLTVYSATAAGTNHNTGRYILSRRTSIGRPSIRAPCIISEAGAQDNILSAQTLFIFFAAHI